MGVVDKGHGEYQPVCDSCGIALCWSLTEREYRRTSSFWNIWECSSCNPEVSLANWIKNSNYKLERIAQDDYIR